MSQIKTKSLVEMMTYHDALQYILSENNRFHIPDAEEAEQITDARHPSFWVSDTLGDRRTVYHKKEQCFVRVHPIMMHHVVLIYEKEKD